MILQALKEYYDRKADDPDSDIAPEGWERKEIPFVIVLDSDGNFIQIEDTREGVGKKKSAKAFLVPRSVNRSREVKANLLWDKAEYIFAGIEIDKEPSKFQKQRIAFVNEIENKIGELESMQILIRFLNDSSTNEKLFKDLLWNEIKKTNPIISFRFINETNLIFNQNEVKNKIDQRVKNAANQGDKIGMCLISGKSGVIAKTHSKTFINRKNNSLISFQKNCGYDSYKKEQGYNAPISRSSESAYVTALNTLLKSERQRFCIGDGVYVCWSSDKTNFETEFSKFFDDPQTRDNPDLFSENVKRMFKSINTGEFMLNEGNHKFYLLGLSPGGGTRISIRFWDSKTIAEYAENIKQYFNDLSIIKPAQYPEYFTIWRLLKSVAQQGDGENIPPQMAGEMVRSIICRLPYPMTLFQAAIRRIHSGIKKKSKTGGESFERVTPEIASLIKAYLNRYYEFHHNKKYKEVKMNLDRSQPSIGYQLGRLFATLEKIQSEANKGINSTIRERFYGAACATPVTVFTNLLRLKNHHLAKLEKRGRVVYFEQLIGEIVGNFMEFPSYLNLHEQGLFAIGYYHQRQVFFEKKNN
jgi:CRISPR-associated protein Csd1